MTKADKQLDKIKYCMLEEDKICDNCLECDICDLDPHKICDNCAKCIDSEVDFNAIEINEIITENDLMVIDEQKPDKDTNKHT